MPTESLLIYLMCFNEAGSIARAVERSLAALDAVVSVPSAGRVRVIDDGSTDGTSELLDGLRRADPRVEIVRHATNLGIGAVLRQIYAPTDFDRVVLCCSDLQFDPLDLPPLVRALDDCDMAQAVRSSRSDKPLRALITTVDAYISRSMFGVAFTDVHWVKAFRGDWTRRVRLTSHSPTIDFEFAWRMAAAGGRITNHALPHYPRQFGVAHGNRLRLIARSAVELIRLRLRTLVHG